MNITNIYKTVMQELTRFVRPDPERHWALLLVVAFVAFFGTVVWNVWAFETVVSGESIPSNVPVALVKEADNESALISVRTFFERRAAEEAKYVNGGYSYTDPSQ